MTGIVHERVVASRDKGMATDWNADHEITGDTDMNQYSWLNQVIENRTGWPAGPVEGQVVYRSDQHTFNHWNGTEWVSLIGPATVVVAADGSGETIDIQEGIDMLSAIGGAVYVREGTYTITTAIDINKNNISLIGAGKSTKIITASDIRMISVTNQSGICIEKLYLYGAGSGNFVNTSIHLSVVSLSIIKNCWIENCGNVGIAVAGSDGNIFDGNYITTCDYGICLDSSDGNHVINNFGYSNEATGISLSGSNNNTISGNNVYSNERHGVELSSSVFNTISGNNVYSNERHGIYLINSSDNSIGGENIVQDNDVNNTTTYDGIHVVNGDRNIIEGNRCENNDRYEINIADAASEKNVVQGNICIGTDHVGAINDAGTNTLPNGAMGTNNLELDDHNILV